MTFFKLIPFFISAFAAGENISFLKKSENSQSLNNQFWHLEFFKNDLFNKFSGKKILVAIIDDQTSNQNSNCDKSLKIAPNFNSSKRSMLALVNTQKSKNHSSEGAKKMDDLKQFIKKNHENCTISIIRRLAPEVSIISIPIPTDSQKSEKAKLYESLKKAFAYKPDILHLSFQILDFDPSQKLDKKIYSILSKFKSVVVPSGNNIAYNNFPPKLPRVFSVASFGLRGTNYPVSDFCIHNYKAADFIMPGEEIWTKVWVPEENNFYSIPLWGTSFSAALMTGLLACLMEKNNKKITKIIHILKQTAVMLDDSWQDSIRWGLPYF